MRLHDRAATRQLAPRIKFVILTTQTVFVFAPHPDDEAIAAGGTMARHRANGDRVVIAFSTDGSE